MRLGTRRFQHPSSTTAMRLSSDQRSIVTMDSGFLVCWDAVSGAERWRARWQDYGNHMHAGVEELATSGDG